MRAKKKRRIKERWIERERGSGGGGRVIRK